MGFQLCTHLNLQPNSLPLKESLSGIQTWKRSHADSGSLASSSSNTSLMVREPIPMPAWIVISPAIFQQRLPLESGFARCPKRITFASFIFWHPHARLFLISKPFFCPENGVLSPPSGFSITIDSHRVLHCVVMFASDIVHYAMRGIGKKEQI
jgi:hypothetical protein